MAEPRLFVLFDARARSGDTDDAAVLDTAESEEEARGCRGDWPEDSVWYEYKPSEAEKPDIRTHGKHWTEVGARYDIKC